jgi:hypothetical protein
LIDLVLGRGPCCGAAEVAVCSYSSETGLVLSVLYKKRDSYGELQQSPFVSVVVTDTSEGFTTFHASIAACLRREQRTSVVTFCATALE